MEKDKNAGSKIPDITGDVVVENHEVSDSALENVVGGVASLPKASTAKGGSKCSCAGSAKSADMSQVG
jgi:hypothetical protein